jgi:hypothetical protein
MSKGKEASMFLRPGMADLLLTTGTLPDNAVGFGKVLSHSGDKVNLELNEATAKVTWYGETLTPNTKVYFNADGKMVSFDKAPAKGATTRGTTGCAKDVRPSTLY